MLTQHCFQNKSDPIHEPKLRASLQQKIKDLIKKKNYYQKVIKN